MNYFCDPLYYKLPTTGNSFQIICDVYRILFNYIGLYISSFLCVLGDLCGFLFFWFRPKAGLCPLWLNLFSAVDSQSLCVSPEQFQVVVVSVFGVEDVDYDVDEVEQDPAALFVAGPAETLDALFLCILTDLIGQ